MEAVLDALAQLIIRALPTLVLLAALHLFLKQLLYRPLDRTLAERYRRTEGARDEARQLLALADERARQCEMKLEVARQELEIQREQLRRRWHQQQAEALAEAHRRMHQRIVEAKQAIEAEQAAAIRSLEARSDALAEAIVEQLLLRRTA